MDLLHLIAYFLPLCFLAVFIGHLGKKFLLYLFWGFLAAVPVFIIVSLNLGKLLNIAAPTINISPVIEEFFKVLPLVLAVLVFRRNTNRDILIYAMAIGIGFSIIENLVILREDPYFFTILIRSFSTSLMHGCTCAVFGYGLVLIRDVDRRALPALLTGFFMVAVLIHAFFNLVDEHFGLVGDITDLILPFLLFQFLLLCYHVDIPRLFSPDPMNGEPGA
ncbi:MAG: PrsW family glutamic-type intramembrane protease [Methanoregula sp.]|jgi:RsiW-degrading membrane proteinase PrsW (M82 family)